MDIALETRTCRVCWTEKPILEFQNRKGTPNRYYRCRPCNAKIASIWNKQNSIRRMAISATRRAKLAGIESAIDGDWVAERITPACPCCHRIFRPGEPTGRGRIAEDRPSLDRIDPLIGYTPENTRIICTRCNRIKNSGSLEDHEMIARWLAAGAPQQVSEGFIDGDGI